MIQTIPNDRSALKAVAAILILAPIVFALGCGRRSTQDYLAAGDQAMHDNQLGTAQEDYETAVKLAPNDPKTHFKLGDLDLFEHNYPAAEAEYTKVASLDPDNAESRAALAKLYSARSQWSSAEDQLRAAVALDPTSAEYRRQLAAVLNRRNQVGQAEIELRTAAGLAPGDAKLHLALANFLATIPNERTSADEEYARVKQLDPTLEPGTSVTPEASSAPPSEAPPAVSSIAPPPSAPAPVAAAAAPKPLKPLNRRFLLTHNSPVYQNANGASAVVAQVHRRKRVHVTGISGDWLQVTLRNGTVGFIPASAAE
ncbi:MAG: tetratricopeptide repeat protein [Candidatus Binataceae bacterium]